MLRTMTFNLRCDVPADGQNAWPHRREIVAELIRERAPDILGIQEGLPHQVAYLREVLAGYGCLGEGRDGGDRGEYNAIFYRQGQLRAIEFGTFWLSETPGVPGSRSWETACVRVATWALLERPAGNGALLFLNTHLDHVSQLARERGAALIIDFLQRRAGNRPVVVTGDFNAPPRNAAVQTLLEGWGGRRLVDALAVHLGLAPGEAGPGTFHGFRGVPRPDSRIDYVLATPDLPVRSAVVLTEGRSGRPVSDHFPVEADFDW